LRNEYEKVVLGFHLGQKVSSTQRTCKSQRCRYNYVFPKVF
jgi:hypothetical protein